MSLIEKLNPKHGKIVETIKHFALQYEQKVYIVGGVVRDLILGKEIKDIDFLIEGNAVEFAQSAKFQIKSIHDDFKTVRVEIENEEIDIASTRSEKYPEMGCLPVLDKVGIKIEEDLKRRDFTVNAIAINIADEKITDEFGGIEDIKNKTLKVLHNKSFQDDPTRILRGLDFKYRFDFDFDKNTEKLIDETVKTFDNKGLSISRIYLTLNKIFQNKRADEILKEILNKEIYKIWTKSVGIKPDEIKTLRNALNIFDCEQNKLFIMALENTPFIRVNFKDDFEIYNFFKKFNPVQLAFYYFKTGDNSCLKYLEIKDIKPLLTGGMLLENGFFEGEIIGKVLNSVLRQKVLNPKMFNNVDDELNFAIENFKK